MGFPGPGIQDPMSENPFFELIGAPRYSHDAQKSRVAAEFESFSQKHNKKYGNDVEVAKRKATFNHNLRCVHCMQCKQYYTMYVTMFAEMMHLLQWSIVRYGYSKLPLGYIVYQKDFFCTTRFSNDHRI